MQITINTDEGLTDLDKSLLRVLAGDAPAAASAPAAKAAPAAKKAAAAPKKDAEPEPETDDAGNDEAVSLEDAVAQATKMVSNGEAAKVKAALATVGAKKVSEVPEDKVSEFIAALG